MLKINKVNHVAIVVADIDESLKFWQDAMGLKVDHVEDVPSQKSTVVFIPVGESELELVKPTSDDTGVAKFIAEKGGGMHHLCFEVDAIDEANGRITVMINIFNRSTPVELEHWQVESV